MRRARDSRAGRRAPLIAGMVLALASLALAQDFSFPPVPEPAENPVTEPKRVLGKLLFWEEQLSSDNTVSRGTCHIPSSGGADPRIGIHPGADGFIGTVDDVFGSLGIRRYNSNMDPIEDSHFGDDHAQDPARTARRADPYRR